MTRIFRSIFILDERESHSRRYVNSYLVLGDFSCPFENIDKKRRKRHQQHEKCHHIQRIVEISNNLNRCYRHLETGRIDSKTALLASKKLSEPSRYKVNSHHFFIRKFWILSMLNTDRSCRNVCLKYIKKSKLRVVCSPSLKLNRVRSGYISTLSLRHVIGFMKIFEDARVIDVPYKNYTTY